MAILNPKARRDQPDPDFRYSSRERDLQIGCIFGRLALCFLACLVAGLFLEGLVKGWFWMVIQEVQKMVTPEMVYLPLITRGTE